MAIELRVVSQEVFDGGADALARHTVYVTDRHARGEERVFAEVLKVSAVHWRAINVYTWSQQKVHAFGACVTPNFGAHALGHRRVPCRRQRNAPGHGCGRSKIADADRAICHLQSRQVQTRDVANEKAVDSTE